MLVAADSGVADAAVAAALRDTDGGEGKAARDRRLTADTGAAVAHGRCGEARRGEWWW